MMETKEQMESGGSSPFVIEESDMDVTPIEGDDAGKSSISAETLQLTNAFLIETLCDILNKVFEMFLDMEEIAFDDDEIKQLSEVWSPIMPEMSPTALAITTTLMILSSKIAIYWSLKRMKKSSLKPDEDLNKESKKVVEEEIDE